MSNKKITAAVIGAGYREMNAYAPYSLENRVVNIMELHKIVYGTRRIAYE